MLPGPKLRCGPAPPGWQLPSLPSCCSDTALRQPQALSTTGRYVAGCRWPPLMPCDMAYANMDVPVVSGTGKKSAPQQQQQQQHNASVLPVQLVTCVAANRASAASASLCSGMACFQIGLTCLLVTHSQAAGDDASLVTWRLHVPGHLVGEGGAPAAVRALQRHQPRHQLLEGGSIRRHSGVIWRRQPQHICQCSGHPAIATCPEHTVGASSGRVPVERCSLGDQKA
ncbi:hypothetical protein COO60DRAFT_981528 [Scenedesmus sp. NREL 46B-D3]|nr:hypothetical protein COO60DRAFT_981528 [Scenedesmus sp. NREL 46B-D3]